MAEGVEEGVGGEGGEVVRGGCVDMILMMLD